MPGGSLHCTHVARHQWRRYIRCQIATFNRTLPRRRAPDLHALACDSPKPGGRVFLFMRISLISGFFLIAFMNTASGKPPAVTFKGGDGATTGIADMTNPH